MSGEDFKSRTLFDASIDNTAQAAFAGAGYLYGFHVWNTNAADAFLQLFDVAAGSVTVGTTTPKLSFLIPAGDGVKAGAFDKKFEPPLWFGTAITYAATTTPAGGTATTVALVGDFQFN